MRLSSYIPAAVAFIVAALVALAVATMAVNAIESASRGQVDRVLRAENLDWPLVSVDGLQVTISGTAPDEATRFRVLTLAGSVVDSTRVIDRMEVEAAEAVEAPRFSIEILRNGSGISLIGLVPAAMDRDALTATIAELAEGAPVTDLLDAADYPVPGGWAEALNYALDALGKLPRSKISVAADKVEITAITDSGAQKLQLETALRAQAPMGIPVTLAISAPRPVITPFTLRFLLDDRGARFDACTAYSEEGRAKILSAAKRAGMTRSASCILALGVPSPRWPDAVATSIAALAELGGGAITFSDADVKLVALDTTPQADFDRIVGELEAALPDVFSLQSVLPEPVKIDGTGEGDGPPEFIATLSPEGLLQLRGRITDERLRDAVEGFARARFGGMDVQGAMRLDPDLPRGWATRVFAAVEGLSFLGNGAVVVQPDFIDIRGKTGNREARANIARILGGQLGGAENFALNVEFVEALEERIDPLSPQECVDAINAILEAEKITFAPGSADIETSARGSVDRIAEVMRDCTEVPMEIGGHTDSQGRETMNQQLSQRRADAVLAALLSRRVLTGNLTAKGYGEAEPIADNGTEDGREANRRIEFKLVQTGTSVADEETTLESLEAPAEDEAAEEDASDEQN